MMTGDRMSWSNPRVLAVLLLVFVSGTLSGAIAFRMFRSRRPPPPPVASAPSWNNKEGFLKRCKKDLNLTDEQAVKVRQRLAKGAAVAAMAREFKTSRQTIMRVRDA